MSETGLIPVVECARCGSIGFPPMYVCRKCGGTDLRSVEIPGNGTIYTHTTIRVAPEAYRDQVPYDIAIIELKPDLRVTARIAGERLGNLKIGDAVVFDKVDQNGYWFNLAG
jgi:uncharacterized protein